MNSKHALALIFSLCAPLAWPQAPAALLDQAQTALKNKQYLQAANLYVKASALSPDDTEFPYHSASAYAMQGNANAAFDWLGRAMQRGFIDSEMLEKDEHFKSLHADPRWHALLDKLRSNQKAWQQIWESPALNTPFQANLSEDEKVAGLSKFWSEVKYNFVYTEKLNQINWDGLYLQYLPKVRASSSTLAYYLLLQELCAKIQDGHTNISVPEQLEDEVYSRPAINTHLVENKVLIKDVMTDELQQKGIKAGMEIIKVNGISAKEWGERMVAPWQSASTTQDLAVRTYRYGFLAGSPGQALELVLQDEQGKTIPLTLPRENWDVRKNWKKINPPPFEFKLLEGNVAYVALNGFGNSAAVDAYLKAFTEISKGSALILDLRKNGGGNSDQGYRVLATLSKNRSRPATGARATTNRLFAPGKSARKALAKPAAW